jgi:hypothetical protein
MRLVWTYNPRYHGTFDTNIDTDTNSRYAQYLVGQCWRFDVGFERDTRDAIAKCRNATEHGRYDPAFPTHLPNAASSSRYVSQPDVHPEYTRLPTPDAFLATFHH